MGERSARADREVTPARGTQAPASASNDAGAAKRPPNVVHARWARGERFDTGRPGGPVARIDGTGETGQGPMDALLSALATCSAIDVIEILRKRRTPASSFSIDVVGTRADGVPRRLVHILLRFRMAGDGIERDQAERAVELAVNKYCSVRDSLDPAIPVVWELELEEGQGTGDRGQAAG